LLRRRIIRLWVYFKRAHNVYFVYALSFFNFITITYTLLLIPLFHFPRDPLYFAGYAVVFGICYTVICIVIGRWDYRKGTVPTEVELSTRVNPWVRDISSAMILLCEGRREEAIAHLKKWTKE